MKVLPPVTASSCGAGARDAPGLSPRHRHLSEFQLDCNNTASGRRALTRPNEETKAEVPSPKVRFDTLVWKITLYYRGQARPLGS